MTQPHNPLAQTLRALLSCAFVTALQGCATTSSSTTKASAENQRSYWKVFEKSDGTCYLIPRPELNPEFPSITSMNNLSRVDANAMAARLNEQLQFRVERSIEGGTLMVRIVPEPLLEDIVDLCRSGTPHALLANRCQKEVAWAARNTRPDIYLQYEPCEAAVMMRELNKLYGRPSPANDVCPQLDQVAK